MILIQAQLIFTNKIRVNEKQFNEEESKYGSINIGVNATHICERSR